MLSFGLDDVSGVNYRPFGMQGASDARVFGLTVLLSTSMDHPHAQRFGEFSAFLS